MDVDHVTYPRWRSRTRSLDTVKGCLNVIDPLASSAAKGDIVGMQ